jgi:pimeloyl-ACP methyl ester carboxylesterase
MTSTRSAFNKELKLGYRVFGSGPLDVIFIHGWMISSAVFDDLLEVMNTQGISGLRLIVPDLRGSGSSQPPQRDDDYTLEHYASDVMAVADAEGARSFVLIGHSMGGQLAMGIAASHPERVQGAVLLCPVPAQGITLPAEAQQLFRNSGQNRGMQQTILGLACKQLSDEARERLLDVTQTLSAACVAKTFDAWSAGAFADRLGAITAPFLIVATDDPFTPPAFLHQTIVSQIARARLAILPGPGHYVQVERPRETAAIIFAFLTALAS